MTGFSILCKHELYAVWRTWHRYVLPTVLCLFGAMSVVLSRFAPDIVGSMMGEAVRKAMPEPNWHEAYNQWSKNLAQTVMFVVIFTGAGATSSLVSSGRAQLLAVRPVSRASQPLAALVARIAVLASASLAGMAVVWAATFGFYRKAPLAPLAAATATWFACACLFLAVTVAMSSLTGSTLAAAGIGVGSLLLTMIGSAFEPIAERSPAGLLTLPSSFAEGKTVGAAAIAVPFATSLVLMIVVVVLGAKSFARREL